MQPSDNFGLQLLALIQCLTLLMLRVTQVIQLTCGVHTPESQIDARPAWSFLAIDGVLVVFLGSPSHKQNASTFQRNRSEA